MYIKKVEITNIKGIEHFEMDFSEVSKPGWHVLIGDNGSGKTTILRCLALAILGFQEMSAITTYNGFASRTWIGKSEKDAEVSIWPRIPETEEGSKPRSIESFQLKFRERMLVLQIGENAQPIDFDHPFPEGFSCGYGPFRRLGGKQDSFFQSGERSKFATLFSEDEGLVQAESWLQGLKLDMESDPTKAQELRFVIDFINTSRLLPDGATLTQKIDSQGIKMRDAAGNEVYFREASDGYRSILSLTLDLIKNMIAQYGIEQVVQHASASAIHLPGVVLIDEIDAHLHPNWQVRIGKWFTDFFPKIQFIVTTHSPLICRGCGDKGEIWHLKTPGSGEKSAPVSELQRKRLVFGDILDAFDTGVFGPNQSSENSVELRERLAELNLKSIRGSITEAERRELESLQSFL